MGGWSVIWSVVFRPPQAAASPKNAIPRDLGAFVKPELVTTVMHGCSARNLVLGAPGAGRIDAYTLVPTQSERG